MQDDDRQKLEDWTLAHARKFEPHLRWGNVFVIDDPQPAALIKHIKQINPQAKIIWRCHIQLDVNKINQEGTAANKAWRYLQEQIKDADLFLFHEKAFVPNGFSPDSKILQMYPATVPLDGMNKPLTEWQREYYLRVFNELAVRQQQTPLDTGRPLITQIARFDPSKGIEDALEAFRLLRLRLQKIQNVLRAVAVPIRWAARHHLPFTPALARLLERLQSALRPQLIIMGNAADDDPEALPLYRNALAYKSRPEFAVIADDIKVILAPHNDQLLNAVLRSSTIATQLSHREGFEFKITEALQKGVPEIIYDEGGMPAQVEQGKTGYIVKTGDVRAVAGRIYWLLLNPLRFRRMSRQAAALTKTNYIIQDNAANLVTLGMMLRNREVTAEDIEEKERLMGEHHVVGAWREEMMDRAQQGKGEIKQQPVPEAVPALVAGILPSQRLDVFTPKGTIRPGPAVKSIAKENLWLLVLAGAGLLVVLAPWLSGQLSLDQVAHSRFLPVLLTVSGLGYAVLNTLAHGRTVVIWDKKAKRHREVPRTGKHVFQLMLLSFAMAAATLGGLLAGSLGIFGLGIAGNLLAGIAAGFALAFLIHLAWNFVLVRLGNLAYGKWITGDFAEKEKKIMQEDWEIYFELLVENLQRFKTAREAAAAGDASAEAGQQLLEAKNDFIEFLDGAGHIMDDNFPLDFIETRYPWRKAASLLPLFSDEGPALQELLLEFLQENYQQIESGIADDLLMMFDIVPDNWLQNKAPEMAGRESYFLTAEYIPVGGGLAYVLDVDADSAMKIGAPTTIVTVRYQNRKTTGGTLARITDQDLGLNDLKVIQKHTLADGTKIKVWQGFQENGVRVILLEEDLDPEEPAKYTNMLYAYNSAANPASWEMFSAFYREAADVVLEELEKNREAEYRDKKQFYQPAVIRGNDAQTSLAVAALKEKSLDDNSSLAGSLIAMTTHTFGNREGRDAGFVSGIWYLFRLPRRLWTRVVSYGGADMTSLGVRSADAPNTVSRKQRIVLLQHWKLDLNARIVSITNGENIGRVIKFFTRFFNKTFPDRIMKLNTLSWNDIMQVKNRAKKELAQELADIAEQQLGFRLEKIAEEKKAEFAEARRKFMASEEAGRPEIFKTEYLKILDASLSGITGQQKFKTPLAEALFNILDDPKNITGDCQQAARILLSEFIRPLADGTEWQLENEEFILLLREMGLYLNSGQPFAFYGGRLVKVKASPYRAFSEDNLRQLMREGRQVVIFGRLQETDESRELEAQLDRLVREFSQATQAYPGNLVFVRQYSDEQKQLLLVAGDVLVLDSDDQTGTCEYTEINGMTAVKISSPWKLDIWEKIRNQWRLLDKKIRGEGIIGEQGIIATQSLVEPDGQIKSKINSPNQRNIWTTVEPANAEPRSYQLLMSELLTMAQDDMQGATHGDFYVHCLQSAHLTKVLNGVNTMAGYLRYWHERLLTKKRVSKELDFHIQTLFQEMEKKYTPDAMINKVNDLLHPDQNSQYYIIYNFNFEEYKDFQTSYNGNFQLTEPGLAAFLRDMRTVEEQGSDLLLAHLKNGYFNMYLRKMFEGVPGFDVLRIYLDELIKAEEISDYQKNEFFLSTLSRLVTALEAMRDRAQANKDSRQAGSPESGVTSTVISDTGSGVIKIVGGLLLLFGLTDTAQAATLENIGNAAQSGSYLGLILGFVIAGVVLAWLVIRRAGVLHVTKTVAAVKTQDAKEEPSPTSSKPAGGEVLSYLQTAKSIMPERPNETYTADVQKGVFSILPTSWKTPLARLVLGFGFLVPRVFKTRLHRLASRLDSREYMRMLFAQVKESSLKNALQDNTTSAGKAFAQLIADPSEGNHRVLMRAMVAALWIQQKKITGLQAAQDYASLNDAKADQEASTISMMRIIELLPGYKNQSIGNWKTRPEGMGRSIQVPRYILEPKNYGLWFRLQRVLMSDEKALIKMKFLPKLPGQRTAGQSS
ncbi:glycosyltransferase [candidate division FCPU426 bacterium]|nr:glycosyltransferase [candidate division FCPU426 bacterium]